MKVESAIVLLKDLEITFNLQASFLEWEVLVSVLESSLSQTIWTLNDRGIISTLLHGLESNIKVVRDTLKSTDIRYKESS